MKKSYDELDFTDDFLFCKILTEHEELCIELVEMIKGRRIRELRIPEAQKSIQPIRDAKGIRLDVYFEDEENVVYDVEMQTTARKDLARRTRYYQGMIDLNILSRGQRYTSLKDSYIIFICTFDAFDGGRYVYTFENVCREESKIRLEDGTHKIFLCAGGKRDGCSEKLKDFLDYIAGKETDGDFSARLRKEVQRAKETPLWRAEYMFWYEYYDDAMEEGYAKGVETTILNLVLDGDISIELAAEKLDKPLDEINVLLEEVAKEKGKG